MTESVTPPVPADADLRGMQFMPLFGDRLFTSMTWISAPPEARCAALRLWWHAFAHEVPAGSLPDNDQMLAEYAGYSLTLKAWLKVKPHAMKGWFKCSDGRLYHAFLAEVVVTQWARRVEYEATREKWREKKRRKRGVSPETSPENGGKFSEPSPGKISNVPENSPEKTLLRERESEKNPPPLPKNSRAHGTNRRATAPRPAAPAFANGSAEHEPVRPPPGMRDARSTTEYIEYMREKTGDPKLREGDYRLSRWQFVPANWAPKAAAG